MLPARLSAAPQPAAAPSESTTPAATSLIAQVVFDVPLDRHFDYQTTVPLAVGQRVRAGFAGRQLTGLVVGMADSSPYVVRPLDGTVDDLPPLPADWLALVHFASRYYHYPLGQTVFTALPAGLRGAKPFALPQDLGYQLTEAGLTQRPAARAVRQCQLYDRLAQGVLPLSEAKTLWSGARKQLGTWLAEGIVAETHPAEPYDQLETRMAIERNGDVAARALVRFSEIAESLRLIQAIAAGLPAGALRADVHSAPDARGFGWVEGWRGDVLIALVTGADGKLRRAHCHDPSWQNWPALEHAVIDNIVPDFPLINKSLQVVMSVSSA